MLAELGQDPQWKRVPLARCCRHPALSQFPFLHSSSPSALPDPLPAFRFASHQMLYLQLLLLLKNVPWLPRAYRIRVNIICMKLKALCIVIAHKPTRYCTPVLHALAQYPGTDLPSPRAVGALPTPGRPLIQPPPVLSALLAPIFPWHWHICRPPAPPRGILLIIFSPYVNTLCLQLPYHNYLHILHRACPATVPASSDLCW